MSGWDPRCHGCDDRQSAGDPNPHRPDFVDPTCPVHGAVPDPVVFRYVEPVRTAAELETEAQWQRLSEADHLVAHPQPDGSLLVTVPARVEHHRYQDLDVVRLLFGGPALVDLDPDVWGDQA